MAAVRQVLKVGLALRPVAAVENRQPAASDKHEVEGVVVGLVGTVRMTMTLRALREVGVRLRDAVVNVSLLLAST